MPHAQRWSYKTTNNARRRPIAEKQASNKTRCARRGVNSRSTRRARPRLPQPTPHAPVPSRSLKEAGAEICYEPPSKLEGATQPCPPVRHGAGLLDTTVYSRVDAHPGRRDPKERCARGTGRNPARLLHSRHGPFRTLSAARAPPPPAPAPAAGVPITGCLKKGTPRVSVPRRLHMHIRY